MMGNTKLTERDGSNIEDLLKGYKRLELPTMREGKYNYTLNRKVRSMEVPVNKTKYYIHGEEYSREITWLALLKTLLYRYTNQNTITIGGMGFSQQPNDSIIALKTDFTKVSSFHQLMDYLTQSTSEASERHEVPLKELNQLNFEDAIPNFQVMFIHLEHELNHDDYLNQWTSNSELCVFVYEKDNNNVIELDYQEDLFEDKTIDQMLEHLFILIERVHKDSGKLLGTIPIITPRENKMLTEWNNTAASFPELCLSQMFERQVDKNPNKNALIFNDETLTYRELNERANQVGHYLKNLGVGPETLVGVFMDRSIEMVVGIYGILKAGGAYVPLDPSHPVDRLSYIMKDSQISTLLTLEKYKSLLPENMIREVVLDAEYPQISKESTNNLEQSVSLDNLAYTIYTSGSTGRPKGVLVEQRNVINTLCAMEEAYRFDGDKTLLFKTPFTFDVSVTELFGWFLNGGQLVILGPQDEKDPSKLVEALCNYNITHLNLVPSLLSSLLHYLENESKPGKTADERQFPSLAYVYVAGEALPPEVAKNFYDLIEGVNLENIYGPTEITIYATHYSVRPEDLDEKMHMPIGKPLKNTHAYVLGVGNQIQPIGTIGELCIGGDGVARGYLNRPTLTSEKFIESPFDLGTKIYRTGDLVRLLQDGNLEYLGRIDHQVKVRGYRVELGEIDNSLIKHDNIRESVVTAQEDESGETYLCAYYTSDKELSVKEIRQHLAYFLPEYMIPTIFMNIEKIPLNESGKVNRNALPDPKLQVNTGAEYEAPRDEIERTTVEMWQKILGVQQISIHDNFFYLGGHSLKAITFLNFVYQKFGVNIRLSSLFESPTVSEISQVIREVETDTEPSIIPVGKQELYPLSSSQKSQFILQQYQDIGTTYNIPCILRIKGNIDIERFQSSLEELTKRHNVLRTSIEIIDGEPKQRVQDHIPIELPVLESRESEIEDHIKDFVKPFDFKQPPLFRAGLIQITDTAVEVDDYILLLDFHHIIFDGVSLTILLDELSKIYLGHNLEPLPIEYTDYTLWEKDYIQSDNMKEKEEYWLKQLSGELPKLQMPTDYAYPNTKSFNGKRHWFNLGEELLESLQKTATETGTTLYMLLLGAYYILLHKNSGQNDIIIGSVSAGRSRLSLENLVGMFANTLALRNYPKGEKSIKSFLQEIKYSSIKASENGDYPLSLLISQLGVKREESRNPLFDAMFVMQNMDEWKLNLDGVESEPIHFPTKTSKVDITLEAMLEDNDILLHLEYCTDMFTEERISRLAVQYLKILKEMTVNIDEEIANMDILSHEEKQRLLLDFNQTEKNISQELLLPELFEEKAKQLPDTVAVKMGKEKLTYNELNTKSNQLARVLQQKGLSPDQLVGIMADRSLEMVIGVMAILKAGGAYVPLDPHHPLERTSYVMKDSNIKLLLTQSRWIDNFSHTKDELGSKIIFNGDLIELDDETIYEGASSNLSPVVTKNNLAYVIYTSGSTGKPKGVMIDHSNLTHIVHSLNHLYPIQEGDSYLLKTPFTFDVSVSELFGWIPGGGKLIVLEPGAERDASQLLETMKRDSISHINFVPSMLRTFIKLIQHRGTVDLPKLKYVLVAGEALPKEVAKSFLELFDGINLENLYGPTETSIFATKHTVTTESLEKWSTVPIGRPLPNTSAYVLNEYQRLQPQGVPGELCIVGEGVGRGYLNLPKQSNEKYMECPFLLESNHKMYRTGDLVRLLDDGQIEFLGRIDDQVKIRGYRIELGEIQSVIEQHPDVNETVVVSHENKHRERQLVAYIVLKNSIVMDQIQSYLKKKLPDYMVPTAYVTLDKMPLNSNGKVDRRALPEPNLNRRINKKYVAPRNQTEKKILKIWCDVLQLKRIGIHDNFFEIGGHSLRATQVSLHLEDSFGIDVPINTLFNFDTIAELASFVDEEVSRHAGQSKMIKQIKKIPEDSTPPLSFAQQRLWFMDQWGANKGTYNIPLAFHLKGKIDTVALEKTFNEIIRRHESLRTIFIQDNKQIIQVIDSKFDFELPVIDFTSHLEKDHDKLVKEWIDKEMNYEFQLEDGPLFYSKLLRLSDDDYILFINMHHIISDAWSINILINEISSLYKSFLTKKENELPTLPIQYKDFAVAQINSSKNKNFKQQMRYWKGKLEGELSVLQLPTDHPRPAQQTYRGNTYHFEIPKKVTQKLKQLSNEEGATLYMTLLSVFKTLLYRYSGQSDVIVGTPIAGRMYKDVEQLIGFFVNTLVLRTDLDGQPTFRELIQRIKEVTLEAYENQDVPFEKLVEEIQPDRNQSHSPLFQVMFVLQNALENKLELQGLQTKEMDLDYETSKYDLTFEIKEEHSQGLKVSIEYNVDLFENETIKRFAKHFQQLLQSATLDPDKPIDLMNYLSEEERRQILVRFNETPDEYPSDKTINDLFLKQVHRTPNKIALVSDKSEWTYRELNDRANQLAHYLQKQGLNPGEMVGISLDRSVDLIIGIIGIIKAGGVYVPLDSSYPVERIQYMVNETRLNILITQRNLIKNFEQTNVKILILSEETSSIMTESKENPMTHISKENLAYVNFTSGSTGKPKGVMVPHRAVVRLVTEPNYVQLSEEEVLLQLAPISFDAATFEIWGSLLNGAKLVLYPSNSIELEELGDIIQSNQVSTLWLTAGLFHQMVDLRLHDLKGIRQLLAGGDVLSVPHVQKIIQELPGCHMINGYGPTENTTFTCCYSVDKGGDVDQHVPIGRPINGTNVYVLDRYKQPVPIGVRGELYVSGDGLANGYINNEDLTKEKFITNPFDSNSNTNMYKTGDVVRWLRDGNLEFLGRADNQVKIRGFRIELGEIENALLEHEYVKEVVVLAHESMNKDKKIVAYIVPHNIEINDKRQFNSFLKERLPEYMVPQALMFLTHLPLTANGKVDRKKLPEPEYNVNRDYDKPEKPLEREIAHIWEEILEVKQIGLDDNFFDLGGHSLLVVRMLSTLNNLSTTKLNIRHIFEYPTVRELSDYIFKLNDTRKSEENIQIPKVEKAPDHIKIPLTYAQQRMWFFEQLYPGSPVYNVPYQYEIYGRINKNALEASMNEIIRRHDILRTTFIENEEGEPTPKILSTHFCSLDRVVFEKIPKKDRDQAVDEWIRKESQRPFDLQKGPLFRASLLVLDKDHYKLFINMHHIITDGWSIGIFNKELSTLYNYYAKGIETNLEEPAIQYKDYAYWEQAYLRREMLEDKLTYWRDKLAGIPKELPLPFDYEREKNMSYKGAQYKRTMANQDYDLIQKYSLDNNVSLYTLLLSVFKVLLYQYTKYINIVIGTPSANRKQEEIQDLMGCFINTIVLSTEIDNDCNFNEIVQRVQQTVLEGTENEEVPFEKLVEEFVTEREKNISPLFQVMFSLQHPLPIVDMDDLEVKLVECTTGTAKFDLSLYMELENEGLTAVWEYNTNLFDEETISTMSEHFNSLVGSIFEEPKKPISSFSMQNLGLEIDLDEEYDNIF